MMKFLKKHWEVLSYLIFGVLTTLLNILGGMDSCDEGNVWLDDPRDFAIFNRIYSQYFSIEHAPARVTVQGHMMNDFKVEMDCVAWKEPR